MNGHVGFNEPGSNQNTVTRKVRISDNSREILSNDFNSQKDVPNEAITLGIKTILSAKKIYLLAWGTGKSDIIKKAIEEDVNEKCPASFLRKHQNVEFILDKYSTSKLNDGLQVNRY
jgi:glucosamine-6-phosphate deaminase